jgi:hypothetical protein
VLLAATVPVLWSRLLFRFFAKVILDIDAWFVAQLLGTTRAGNMVTFADGSGSLVLEPACSSLANMSLAFLCSALQAHEEGRASAMMFKALTDLRLLSKHATNSDTIEL